MAQRLSGQEFQIGFAMAGAISAGAYSAGVLDFFIQALEAWENARLDPIRTDDLPNHRVGIKVITGASAGAITGALGAIALAQGVTPKQIHTTSNQTVNCVLPSLYDTWVVKPSMVSPTSGNDFLQTGDIERDGVISLLNSDLLNDIREGALKLGPRAAGSLPYISSTLHIYMTVTNLRGVPYHVTFEGGNFGMMTHGDRIHYCIKDLGSWTAPSKFADPDNPRMISVHTLFGPNGPSTEWQTYTKEAVASGAFPAGLAPRPLAAPLAEYQNRSWPLNEWHLNNNFVPSWPAPWGNDKSRNFPFLSVDGGMVNNEPFEYTRFCLMDEPPEQNPRDGEDADRAVIMIDPFPEPPDFLPDGKPDDQLISVVKALIPVMKNQARFKPSELVLAASEAIFSRYLIAPSRTILLGKEEPFAIACGLLGGFGGFLSRKFREHDFILGQRNCQRFLATSFALPAYNKIIQRWPAIARANPKFVVPSAAGGPNYYCIIPLIDNAAIEIQVPQWPQIAQADLDILQTRIEQRLDKVAKYLIATNGPGGIAGSFLSFIYSRNSDTNLRIYQIVNTV